MRLSALALLILLAALCSAPARAASDRFLLQGRVLDLEGNPVAGGEVFVYDSAQTRRPADFIAPKTGRDGVYRLEIPAGKYWLVARVRGAAKYGPLAWGGRHSGEPQELEAAAGQELALDFNVADVREMSRKLRRSEDDEGRTVAGRILDPGGKPVPGAYAFARRGQDGAALPEFISAWTDADGSYTLQLPPGSYLIGASKSFPPEGESHSQRLQLDSASSSVSYDIALKATESKIEAADHDDKEND